MIAAAPTPPAAIVYQPYPAFGFAASGGLPPYSWRLTSASLPPGLMMAANGTVSGTPTAAGENYFSVTATDSAQTPMQSSPLATEIVSMTKRGLLPA